MVSRPLEMASRPLEMAPRPLEMAPRPLQVALHLGGEVHDRGHQLGGRQLGGHGLVPRANERAAHPPSRQHRSAPALRKVQQGMRGSRPEEPPAAIVSAVLSGMVDQRGGAVRGGYGRTPSHRGMPTHPRAATGAFLGRKPGVSLGRMPGPMSEIVHHAVQPAGLSGTLEISEIVSEISQIVQPAGLSATLEDGGVSGGVTVVPTRPRTAPPALRLSSSQSELRSPFVRPSSALYYLTPGLTVKRLD